MRNDAGPAPLLSSGVLFDVEVWVTALFACPMKDKKNAYEPQAALGFDVIYRNEVPVYVNDRSACTAYHRVVTAAACDM